MSPQPAADNDHWLRHVIEGGAVRSTPPRVKVKHLENKFEKVVGKPWEQELSGRMLTLAHNIRDMAEAAATNAGLRFRHLIYASVAVIRTNPNLDVFSEPVNGDDAHANFVIKQMPIAPPSRKPGDPKQPHEIFREIAQMLQVCDAADISHVEALRQ